MPEEKAPKDCTMAERRALYSKHKNAPSTDREARRLERVLWLYREMPRLKPAHVIDIGCESGFISRWMVDEPYVQEVYGIDPSEFSIVQAKELIKKRANPEKARYEVAGWEELNPDNRGPDRRIPEGLFDASICFECIEHFLPEEGVLLIQKINSIIRQGGTSFMCTPKADGRYGLSNPDPWHLKIYTNAELADLVKRVTGADVSFEESDSYCTLFRWSKP